MSKRLTHGRRDICPGKLTEDLQERVGCFEDAVVDEAGGVDAEGDETAGAHDGVGADHGSRDDFAGVRAFFCHVDLGGFWWLVYWEGG